MHKACQSFTQSNLCTHTHTHIHTHKHTHTHTRTHTYVYTHKGIKLDNASGWCMRRVITSTSLSLPHAHTHKHTHTHTHTQVFNWMMHETRRMFHQALVVEEDPPYTDQERDIYTMPGKQVWFCFPLLCLPYLTLHNIGCTVCQADDGCWCVRIADGIYM